MSQGFFYIIKTADTPEGVYKIGKTTQADPNKRLCRYPAGSCCMFTIYVANADLFEDIVMRKLLSVSKRRREFGLEYYEMPLNELIDHVYNLWKKYGQLDDEKLDKNVEKLRPNGWQYFVNEWLSKKENPAEIDAEEAYRAYVDIVRDTFMSSEYAEFELFAVYFRAIQV